MLKNAGAVVRNSPHPYAGRGLFANKSFKDNELIFTETPLLSVVKSGKSNRQNRCQSCWSTTVPTAKDSNSSFCAQHAKSLLSMAMRRLETIQTFRDLRTKQLNRLESSEGREGGFSIMITDLIGLSLSDLLLTGSLNKSANLVQNLVTGKEMPIEGIPSNWKTDYNEIKSALLTGRGLDQVFSLNWYCNTMMRLNLNAIQIVGKGKSGYEESSSVNGTGLYLFASMLNHSCIPNVRVDWSEGNSLTVWSSGTIEEGEELYMNYLGRVVDNDTIDAFRTRREYFRYNYGFICSCPVCMKFQ